MKYPLSMRIMHIVMAILVLGTLTVGYFRKELGELINIQYGWMFWHKSFGILILLLTLLRMLIRSRSQVPPYPPTFPAWEKRAASLTHLMLYALLVVVPLFGYLLVSAAPKSPGISFFGISLPEIFSKSDHWANIFAEQHIILAYTLFGFIVLHAVGALWHQWGNPQNRVLKRMF